MNTTINPPAFPRPGGWENPQDGMTLRDYFAAKAMPAVMNPTDAPFSADEETSKPCVLWADFAKAAYMMADAMLAERQKAP